MKENIDIEKLLPAVKNAGSRIMEIYNLNPEAEIKKDGSPVTIADKAAEKILLTKIKELFPNISIVSEENPDSHLIKTSEEFFLVDPLDGTKEFIKCNGEFTVNIALIENYQPVLGVIHIPVSNETFTGMKGQGAKKIKDHQNHILPKQPDELRQPPIFAVSRSHLNQQTKDFIQRHQAETIAVGSSLKLTLLAEGLADAYPRFGPTSLWDMAAGHAILKETGGEIYTLCKQPLVYNIANILNPDLIAVRNNNFKFAMEDKYES